MLVCAAGDCHGALEVMYDRILRLEEEVGRRVDVVVQVGDLGVWPDSSRLDRATRSRGQEGDFPSWWEQQRRAPRPTVFIAGNHEDFSFLSRGGTRQILPDLHFLSWGEVLPFEAGGERLLIGGVGGCYGMKDYPQRTLVGGARRHYLHRELVQLADRCDPRIDVLMLHDAPAGEIVYPGPKGTRVRTSRAEGLAELVAAVRPRLCLTGHLHVRSERELSGVRVAGLNLVPHPGSLLLLDFLPGEEAPLDVAEWGGTSSPPATTESVAGDLQADAGPLRELVRRVYQWAGEVLGDGHTAGEPSGREWRKRLHVGHPHQRVLMCALKDPEPAPELEASGVWRAIEEGIPAAMRAEVLTRWQAGGLPDPEWLRRQAGLAGPS